VPEDRHIFAELTVWENLDAATRASGRNGDWTIEAVYKLFPIFARLAHSTRRISIGRRTTDVDHRAHADG
jgi:ABC-type branched-subunit amino acid transport system ATPase component